MQGSGGLMTAKGVGEKWKSRGDRRGHGQSSPDHERKGQEYHNQISHPLQRVVGAIFGRLWEQVVEQSSRQYIRGQVKDRWQQVFSEMAGDQSVKDIPHPNRDDDPGGLKVKIPA